MTFQMEYNELLVLCTKQVRATTKEVMELHSIPNMVSKDLLADLGDEVRRWL